MPASVAGPIRHTLIIGCGDTGVRVAARLVASAELVTGLVRSQASAARVRSIGARAIRRDLDQLGTEKLPDCDRLLYFAPPGRAGHADYRMGDVLARLPRVPTQLVYISTSGVYGDCQGDWVDETRPVDPQSERGQRRADAERQIADYAPHAVILRAPGIYGPNRLPVSRVLDREPILDDAEGGWSNRIHIDDLATIAYRAGTERWPHSIYNACDGLPTRLSTYYDALAELLGVEPVPRISWAEAESRFSAMRLSFLRESRRLSNRRLVDTGFESIFCDFREGLAASLKAESAD
ncbi:MAG: SDR family oxidoreductase [Salinisphaera sp.]|jgi:nucleoside-diphosphate-sugar epimerase|nr:SDR family oxidoreductase [Salinisphaera sp.]